MSTGRSSSGASAPEPSNSENFTPTFVSQYLVDFRPISVLGNGAFGLVFLAKKGIDGVLYAVKRISLPEKIKYHDTVKLEVLALSRLMHPNIVRYFNAWIERPPEGWIEQNDPLYQEYKDKLGEGSDSCVDSRRFYGPDPYHLYLQQEFCPRRTLRVWLENHRERENVMPLLSQILDGLEYIHAKRVIHRDLKPENIFISTTQKNLQDIEDELVLKIGDFGLASIDLTSEDVTNNEISQREEQDSSGNSSDNIPEFGTELYKCPVKMDNFRDANNSFPFDSKLDIYAAGVIAFELFVDLDPKTRRGTIDKLNKFQTYPAGFQDAHAFEHQLVQEMLTINPNDRPDATTIKEKLLNYCNSGITLPILYNVSDSATKFHGREQNLTRLNDILTNRSPTGGEFIVVTGMGGMEKSELAKQFAIQTFTKRRTSIVWLHGNDDDTLNRSTIEFAENTLKIATGTQNGKRLPLPDIFKLIHQFFKGTEWLLIIDNIEKISDLIKSIFKSFTSYLPLKPVVLLTTRYIDVLPGSKVITLDVLSEQDAAHLIASNLEDVADSKDETVVLKLCKLLQNFPLAINQAVGYILEQNNETLEDFSISKYLEIYSLEKASLLGFEIQDIKHDNTLTTLTTWNTTLKAIQAIEGIGVVACQILNFLAYCESDEVPVDFVATSMIPILHQENSRYIPEDDIKKSIILLRKYNMCKLPSKRSISVHRLVQEIIRLKIKPTEDTWLAQIFSVFHHMAEKGVEPSPKSHIPHIASIWTHGEAYAEIIGKFRYFPTWVTRTLHKHHLYQEADDFGRRNYHRMIALRGELEPKWDDYTISTWTMGNAFCEALWSAGHDSAAYHLYHYFFLKEREILGINHPLTISTGYNVLRILSRGVDTSDSSTVPNFLQLTDQLCTASRKIFGDKHEMTVLLENLYVSGLSWTGQEYEAWEFYEQIQNKLLPRNTNRTWEITVEQMTTQLSLLRLCGNNPENFWVGEMVEEFIQDLSQSFTEEDPLMQEAKVLLANELYKQRKFGDAFKMLADLNAKQVQIFGSNHPITKATCATIIRLFPQVGIICQFAGFLAHNNYQIDGVAGTMEMFERFKTEWGNGAGGGSVNNK